MVENTRKIRVSVQNYALESWKNLISIPLLASICGLLLLFTFAMFRGLRNQSEKGGKDQESVQSSTTPDPGYHIGK